MRWLITGGCGFIGTRLIEELAREGDHRIAVLDNLTVGSEEDLAAVQAYRRHDDVSPHGLDYSSTEFVELVVGDVRDTMLVDKVAKNADVVIHLAANTGVFPSVENPRQDAEINVLGTLNVLEAARNSSVQRVVFASSGAPVGEVEPPIHENLAPHPVSPYGASKLAGEGYCSAYYRTFGVDAVALRFGNVYGPGSTHKTSVVAKFITQSLRGESLTIYGDGSQTRDFIYVYDLVQAVRQAAMTENVGGEIFQIASSRETTIGELAELLIKVMSSFGIEPVPIDFGETRPGDVKRNFSDTRKAKELLHWQARYDLQEGIRTTVAYFLDSERKCRRSQA